MGRTMAIVFVRVLTAIHAIGSLFLVAILSYLLLGGSAQRLARTPGSRLMVDVLGPWLPAFFGCLAAFLATTAWSLYCRRLWAWRAAVAAYSVGILGSLWEVSIGMQQAWVAVFINGAVVAMLLSRSTRSLYARSETSK